MKIAVHGQTEDCLIIEELLFPWDVSFCKPEDSDVVVSHGMSPIQDKPTIIIPYSVTNSTNVPNGPKISVAAGEGTELVLCSRTYFGKSHSQLGEGKPFFEKNADVVLNDDLIKEFKRVIHQTLSPSQSRLHHLVTSLPIPYGIAPKQVRDYIIKRNSVMPESLSLQDKLPIDAARFLLVQAIEKASGKKIKKKKLFENKFVCIFTHDVESASGMEKARLLKKLEEKYDVPSAWFIPSTRYKLKNETIRTLSNHGEIGAHDTKHDGKLIHQPEEKLKKRLADAKQELQKICHQGVEGFRAPILQHNFALLHALAQTGYCYDSSIPTWEPKHPFTMKPHGIGTVYPLTLGGITEIPLTLPQDHQLVEILNLQPKEILKVWMDMVDTIRKIGGLCMFLVHPDYAFSERGGEIYEELVNNIASDSKAQIELPLRINSLTKE